MLEDQAEILLVEDDSGDVELILHSLNDGRSGIRVEVARDGEEALDYLFCRGPHSLRDPDMRPKLILLDLKLPKVNGLQVLDRLKSDPRTRAVPVVILTSSIQEQDLARGYRLGVNSYVQKPVDFDQFRAAIWRLGRYWLSLNQPPPQVAFQGDIPDEVRSRG